MINKIKHSTIFALIVFGSHLSLIEPTLANKTKYLKEDKDRVITRIFVADKWKISAIQSELEPILYLTETPREDPAPTTDTETETDRQNPKPERQPNPKLQPERELGFDIYK